MPGDTKAAQKRCTVPPMTSRGHRGARVGGAALASVVAALLGTGGLVACGVTRGLVLGELVPDGNAEGGTVDVAAPEAECVGCPFAVTVNGQSLTPQQGGTTGTAFTDTCPGNQAVIGYQGFLTDPAVGLILVGGIQTLCGELGVGDAGQLTTSAGATLPMEGTSEDSPWTQLCPADQVVVGFVGRSGADLDQVAFECAPWSASNDDGGEALSMGTVVTLTAAGGDGGLPYDNPCPAGQMARGSSGRSGDWVDAFGLVCGTPALVADGGP